MNFQRPMMAAICCLAILAGCAAPTTRRTPLDEAMVLQEERKQLEIALQTFLRDEARLYDVSYPLLRAALPLCKDEAQKMGGLIVATRHDFPGGYYEAAISTLGLGDELQVIHVVRASAAASAGFKTGDRLLSINNAPAPTGQEAARMFFISTPELFADPAGVDFSILRQGEKIYLTLLPTEGCGYSVDLDRGDSSLNAGADGKRVLVTRGMLDFANDQELSLVIAHELSHNAMKHIDAKMRNYLFGAVFDIAAAVYGVNTGGLFGETGAGVYSKEFEAEADYVSLYVMARAGLEIENAADFWRRMAASNPGSINKNSASSHPSTPERFVGIENTVKEIRAKQAAGLPLLPEVK